MGIDFDYMVYCYDLMVILLPYDEWMNEWRNEWMNEWLIDWLTDRPNWLTLSLWSLTQWLIIDQLFWFIWFDLLAQLIDIDSLIDI